jgi:hypothetical protein
MTVATLIRTAYGYQPAALDFMNGSEGSKRKLPMRLDLSYGLGKEDGVPCGEDRTGSAPTITSSMRRLHSATGEQMIGPMLLELLESRFQLKAHIESEPTAAFALTVAPGLKVEPAAEGECTRTCEPGCSSEAQRLYGPTVAG